jgi:hypothetical protein
MKTKILTLFVLLFSTFSCFSQDTITKVGKKYKTPEDKVMVFEKYRSEDNGVVYRVVLIDTASSTGVVNNKDTIANITVIVFEDGSTIESNAKINLCPCRYNVSFTLSLKEIMQFKMNPVKYFELHIEKIVYKQEVKDGQKYMKYLNCLINTKI